MKIILSRKGFDSSAGGVASPITPDGRLISLPIPDTQSAVQYRHLKGQRPAVATWVEQLSRSKVRARQGVHLDPDLDKNQLSRSASWQAAFGQAGAALGHLDKQGVTEGDLFLFFGWFRRVEKHLGAWRYIANAPDIHVLYGWLSVGSIWRQPAPIPDSISQHIHCHRKFAGGNAVFIASQRFIGPAGITHPGFGLWPQIHAQLVLTEGERRSQWTLPDWFFPENRESCLSYHQNRERWALNDSACHLELVARGQEFVLDCEHYPEAIPWASKLIALAH